MDFRSIYGDWWMLYEFARRKLQKAFAETNGLSVAADLIEESLGLKKQPNRA